MVFRFEIILVGMRFNEVTMEEAVSFNSYALVPEPTNPHDAKAIKVYGVYTDGTRLMLGHVARGSQPAVPSHPYPLGPGDVWNAHSASADSPAAARLVLFRHCI
jgi:hypothetical protein